MSRLKERSKGHACGLKGRYRCGLTSSFDVRRRCPAVESSVARVVANPLGMALWAPILHSRMHWKMWLPNWVKIQGTSLFDGMLQQRETRGYNVCGERRLGSKWRCWGSLV
jgi:hypothetical protein